MINQSPIITYCEKEPSALRLSSPVHSALGMCSNARVLPAIGVPLLSKPTVAPDRVNGLSLVKEIARQTAVKKKMTNIAIDHVLQGFLQM